MRRILQFFRTLVSPGIVCAAALVIGGSTAQTPPSFPTVDLSIGPVAVNTQAINIALALSVEFPTVGAAYRQADYNHATTYLGYFDPKGCYKYRDTTVGAPVNGEYFLRTGNVDTDGYCETAASGGGRYSGNALNYVTTSSIDLLRYALTGGDRAVDTADTTILQRAYLYNGWNLHNGTYFPSKRFPQAMVGRVIPPFITGSDVYGGGCQDKVWFGTSNAGASCTTPGTSGNLNPTTATVTVTTVVTSTVTVPYGAPAPTGNTVTFITTTWAISNPLVTVSSASAVESPTVATSDPPLTSSAVPVLTGGTTTSLPPAPITTATAYLHTMATEVTGTYSLTPPVAPGGTTTVPPINTSSLGTIGLPYAAPRYFYSQAQAAPFRTHTFTVRSGQTTSVQVCRTNNSETAPGPYMGRFNGTTNNFSDVPNGSCGSGAHAGFPSRGRIRNTILPATVYERLNPTPTYRVYTYQRVYSEYTIRTDYHVYIPSDQYQVSVATSGTATVTTTAAMFARVRVCDDTEKTSRTDLCERFPNGNYKPIGEIQRYNIRARVSAFGYLADNSNTRYGGVLRAPMKFTGPKFLDQDGVLQTNANPEWDANTGVFATDPLNASPTYAFSGVINYLNKFGRTGTLGYYKGLDPVGELYYEAIRYFQGLGPTALATDLATPAMADGFPYYTTSGTAPAIWQDPVQNACERSNFILTIGDVNTHWDKHLPGHRRSGSSMETSTDLTRAAVAIPGTTTLFDATDWTNLLTGFETGTSIAYVDSKGRAQNTTGNPNTNSNNTNLAINTTGSGGRSAYYWAGAAYWANTQSIRADVKGGMSMRDVRVKTFTIDVDEGGNGDIEDTNPRGIKPRRSAAYLAGKYGWFLDKNDDGNPFRTEGGAVNNTEWEDPSAPNTPDGYVIASQAAKMIAGIRKFFEAASNVRGAASTSAVSSARFTANSPDGDFFAPKFEAGDWTGTIERTRLVLNTSTGDIEALSAVVWDAGKILTLASTTSTTTPPDPYVRPADRKILTMKRDSGSMVGIPFTVADKNDLDALVLSSLNTNPGLGTTDSLADERINWLRGVRSNEIGQTGGTLRARKSVMGDIINSGPVFKQGADPTITGPGYLAFAQSVSGRTAMLYVGANDGMFHAFRASDGKEMFAYIPRAVGTNLNKLTRPGYTHQPYVDAIPLVSEAQVGANWRTLAISGMGGGAQGLFALDVTAPASFTTTNVLWEFTDQDDPQMGNIVTQPQLMKLKVAGTPATYKWFVVVGSGYNNYKSDSYTQTNGEQALFFLSVDKAANANWQLGTNYFKVSLPYASGSIVNGLSNPAALNGALGEAKIIYAGDLQGNLWKFDVTAGLSTSNLNDAVFKVSSVKTPLFVATDSLGARQPITIPPAIVEANERGQMVLFGTGKFVEPSDATTVQTQAIYGIWDSLESTATDFAVPKAKLYQRTATLTGNSVTVGSATFAFGLGTGKYRGWYFNLPQTRERVAVDSSLGKGLIVFSAAIPEGTCSGDGLGRRYCLNPVTGAPVPGCSPEARPGIPGTVKIIDIELDPSSYTARSPTGRRTASIEQAVVGSSTKLSDSGAAQVSTDYVQSVIVPAGRINWRELRQ
jgi:type IV pilus assembly protein PilY1